MKLVVFDETKSQIWNRIISQSQNGTLFHTWEWLKIAEKHSESQLLPLVFFDVDDDKAFGAIPLFLMKKMGLKMVFSPPPISSITLGPVLLDKDYRQHKFEIAYLEFQRQIDEYIKNLHVNYTSILTSPGLVDMRPFLWSGYTVRPSYTYKIDLSLGEKALWSRLSSSLRPEINQTRKKGIQIIKSHSDKKQISELVYSTLTSRYLKQSRRFALKKPYLDDLLEQFGDSGIRILSAQNNGKTLGAQLYCIYKNTVTLWAGFVRPESNDLEVNGLMLWEMITDSIKAGYRWLENMGANTPHLCSYKSKFDPATELCFEIKKADLWGSAAEKAYLLHKGSPSRKYDRHISPNLNPKY
jgi:hypothetical protein